jgi:hypothetical protein
VTNLATLLAEHRSAPFPDNLVKGIDYGSVDAVMIGSDIYGWAVRVADGRGITAVQRERLRTARDELQQSLPAFPEDARPYYEMLVEIASAALL